MGFWIQRPRKQTFISSHSYTKESTFSRRICSYCLPPAKSQKARCTFSLFPHRAVQMQGIQCNISSKHLLMFRDLCLKFVNTVITFIFPGVALTIWNQPIEQRWSLLHLTLKELYWLCPHYFWSIYLSINIYNSVLSIKEIKMHMMMPMPSRLFIKS